MVSLNEVPTTTPLGVVIDRVAGARSKNRYLFTFGEEVFLVDFEAPASSSSHEPTLEPVSATIAAATGPNGSMFYDADAVLPSLAVFRRQTFFEVGEFQNLSSFDGRYPAIVYGLPAKESQARSTGRLEAVSAEVCIAVFRILWPELDMVVASEEHRTARDLDTVLDAYSGYLRWRGISPGYAADMLAAATLILERLPAFCSDPERLELGISLKESKLNSHEIYRLLKPDVIL